MRDMDTPTSNSSSSSTTDSTEGEAVRLLPLPPRILPQSLPLRSPPTLTTSVSSTVTSLPQPPGCLVIYENRMFVNFFVFLAAGDQGVIPKRRQHSGTCQIGEFIFGNFFWIELLKCWLYRRRIRRRR